MQEQGREGRALVPLEVMRKDTIQGQNLNFLVDRYSEVSISRAYRRIWSACGRCNSRYISSASGSYGIWPVELRRWHQIRHRVTATILTSTCGPLYRAHCSASSWLCSLSWWFACQFLMHWGICLWHGCAHVNITHSLGLHLLITYSLKYSLTPHKSWNRDLGICFYVQIP